MPDNHAAEYELIAAIETNARRYFPEAAITVQRTDANEGWALVVNDDGRTHRFSAATLRGLLTKFEIAWNR
jgi:hypothetical protein